MSNRRTVWLREGALPNASAAGRTHSIALSQLGHAAARETFLTATLPFAATWTGLFEEMLVPLPKLMLPELQWREDGPGTGRDARSAYSSLLGRYMARAYLTDEAHVRVLVPLDMAKKILAGTDYKIERRTTPAGNYEADWIGLDYRRRLIIAEAKGSRDTSKKSWRDTNSIPDVLTTGIGQARRTAVVRKSTNSELPASRWAIASRWGNHVNRCEPTLLAWNDDGGFILDEDDYRKLAHLLLPAELGTLMEGLGHSAESPALTLVVGSRLLTDGPGYAALVGPIGILPLRDQGDVELVRRIREIDQHVALVSLDAGYTDWIRRDLLGEREDMRVVQPDPVERVVGRFGLTVAWPTPEEDIKLRD